MKPITLSINPSYHCNLRCDFCYLTNEQLADRTRIDIDRLDQLLSEVKQNTTIEYVDLYGGEIGLLSSEYYQTLIQTIKRHYSGEINVVTNLTMPADKLITDDVWLTVSYDFEAREMNDRVFFNMLNCSFPYSVLILASPKILKKNVNEMITTLNACSQIESVEIKPYSKNQSNSLPVTDVDFENFVKSWITSPVPKRFSFVNEDRIHRSLAGEYNAFSDDHLYITPAGKFAVLEFDDNDREYFKELDTFSQYLDWIAKERQSISKICTECEYFGHCLTEHYRYVTDIDNSCNGYRLLLDWYKNERMEG